MKSGAPRPDSKIDACITGIGLASALGLDVETSCAAARAGISRAVELDYFKMKSIEDGEVGCAKGHPLPGATGGFEGPPRYLAVARPAFTDFTRRIEPSRLKRDRTGVYLAVPDLGRLHAGMDIVSDEAVRETRIAEQKKRPAPDAAARKRCWEGMAGRLFDRVGGTPPGTLRVFDTFGHCGGAAAIGHAVSDLGQRRTDFAVVGGVDSLLEEETLQWLLDTGRLKTEDTAAGLQPGEAGAFILLERRETAAKDGVRILGRITGIAEAEEAKPLLSGGPATGQGIFRALMDGVGRSGRPADAPLWLISDQNGEPYRAHDWGVALTRLVNAAPGMGESRLWYPALAFGDTGAASGIAAVCIAVRAFGRGYAASDTAVVVSAADGKARSAVFVSGPEARGLS